MNINRLFTDATGRGIVRLTCLDVAGGKISSLCNAFVAETAVTSWVKTKGVQSEKLILAARR